MAAAVDHSRPRNLDWKRAAALLYGDWGTSKAYVIGFAFLALAFASLHTILAVCAITGLVGINYAIVCRYFPDGGGVYSAARSQGRALAVGGALLLVADLTVTAALSGYDSLKYLFPTIHDNAVPWCTILVVLIFGFLNSFGPHHSGGVAFALAIPMVLIVFVLIAISAPHLTSHLAPLPPGHTAIKGWHAFVSSILALSGVEAIASLTGVMKPDKDSPEGAPSVRRESAKAILPVAVEVVLGTALLGWATVSLSRWGQSVFQPELTMLGRLTEGYSHVLRVLGEEYGTRMFGQWGGATLGVAVGIIVGLLLLSAVNTAIAALIGMLYTLARDGEMPHAFLALNRHGVPKLPLYVAIGLPCIVLFLTLFDTENALTTLQELYAIGVVGAITVNLGSCAVNWKLPLKKWERGLFGVTFVVLFCVELTLAYDKHLALFFVCIVLGLGFWLRLMAHKAEGMETILVAREVAESVSPEAIARLRPAALEEGRKILVSARGLTPVLRFALNEAHLHKAVLCVLYIKEVAILLGGAQPAPGRAAKWQDDPQAAAIMSLMLRLGEEAGVCVQPVYAVSSDPAGTIVDISATLGADIVMLGSTHRSNMSRLLKGNVIERVADQLPEEIELVIYG